MYRLFFTLFFSRMDPERAHHLAFAWIRLAARVSTMAVAHRWMAPVCWASSPTVQPGHVGTSTVMSGASPTTAANVEISFSARSQYHS